MLIFYKNHDVVLTYKKEFFKLVTQTCHLKLHKLNFHLGKIGLK